MARKSMNPKTWVQVLRSLGDHWRSLDHLRSLDVLALDHMTGWPGIYEGLLTSKLNLDLDPIGNNKQNDGETWKE